jgi:Arc/MetJ-type ribon-helix-helix transcriptional regulator
MSTELSPDKDRLLEKLVASGQFANRQQALDRAVDLLQEEAETLAAIRDGLASMQRGEGRDADEVLRELRERFDISADT